MSEDEKEKINEITRIMEDAKWDMKAEDREEARENLEKAKKIAKKIRNEKLLKQIVELIKETYASKDF